MIDEKSNFKTVLQQHCAAMSIPLSELQLEQFEKLKNLLLKWNKAYNLTALKTEDKILSHHFMDSLTLIPHIEHNRIIDVGTGAGFPGLPLAIFYPEKQFVLLDSNGKKIRFVRHAISQLNLNKAQAMQHRVEEYQTDIFFDHCIVRAFSSLTDIVKKCRHLLKPNGTLIAMKGKLPKQELEEIEQDKSITSKSFEKLGVPNLNEERNIVILTFNKNNNN